MFKCLKKPHHMSLIIFLLIKTSHFQINSWYWLYRMVEIWISKQNPQDYTKGHQSHGKSFNIEKDDDAQRMHSVTLVGRHTEISIFYVFYHRRLVFWVVILIIKIRGVKTNFSNSKKTIYLCGRIYLFFSLLSQSPISTHSNRIP